ncbi:U-box domain-containing protein 32 isoform X1 [Tanacetum coccineum]
MEIMEATQDFNQSLKIGEGRYGSVYKGILRHVRIAIKMLPSLGSQGDAEFEDEVNPTTVYVKVAIRLCFICNGLDGCPLLKQASFLSEFYTWTYEPIRA